MLTNFCNWLLHLVGLGPAPASVFAPVPSFSTLGVGVEVHFVNGRAADLKRIASWGSKYVRMDFVPAWTLAAYDDYLTDVFAAGLTPVLITPYNYAPGSTSGTSYPTPAAYATAVAAAAAHFSYGFPGKPIIWEVMNEPDVVQGGGTMLRYSGAAYYAYLTATAAAIRACAPTHAILTGGTSGYDLSWHQALAALLKAGEVDGIGFHPYGVAPGSLAGCIGTLYATYGKKFSIYLTEFGATSAAALLSMLRAAVHFSPMFIAYVYQEVGAATPQYNLVQPSDSTASSTAPATPTLSGLLSFTDGKDNV